MVDFDFASTTTVEFGVGLDMKKGPELCLVPVDGGVQDALRKMAVATQVGMLQRSKSPRGYEASEIYGSSEHLYLPLADELTKQIRLIHQAQNVLLDPFVLKQPSQVFFYFVYISDRRGRRLTAIRRATQFKGVLKSRLIRLFTDTLKMVEDRIFKLDEDFDLLVDGSAVFIFRPGGFESIGKLQGALLGSVHGNIRSIREDLHYIDFETIEEYARTHPRAARYLASIRVQKEARNIDKHALEALCHRTGVLIREAAGKITVEPADVLGFLEVLDRRRYDIELVRNVRERFRASSRQRIDRSSTREQKGLWSHKTGESLREAITPTVSSRSLPAVPSEEIDH